MNNIYRIAQYIQPWEVDDVDRQVDQLIRSGYYVENTKSIILDMSMNTEIVDWPCSKLPLDYFINKFKYIETKARHHFTTEFTINDGSGCVDKRRQCQDKDHDYVIWLDSDVYFPIITLPYLIKATQEITDQSYILSPQIIKYWDSSWDCLTADQFLDQPYNHRDFFDSYSLDNIIPQHVHISKNNTVKFGGGWFNLFSRQVFSDIKIPIELGSYGYEDTYVSICASITNIPQYILSGIVVTEIGKKYLKDKNYIKPLLSIKINDKQKITEAEFGKLIEKLYNKVDE